MKISASSSALPRSPLEDVVEYVRDAPLTSLAIAAAAGFLVGGGARNRMGSAVLGIVGRIVIQGAATAFVAALVTEPHRNENARSASSESARYDKAGRESQESG